MKCGHVFMQRHKRYGYGLLLNDKPVQSLDWPVVIALKKLVDTYGNHCRPISASVESFIPMDCQAITPLFLQSAIVLWIKRLRKRHVSTVFIIHSVKDVLVWYGKRGRSGRMKCSMKHGCVSLSMTIIRCCQFRSGHYASMSKRL